MTPFTLMGHTVELENDAEAKWLQDQMDSIFAIAWLSGYRIDFLDLGGKPEDTGVRVFKFNFYHNRFNNGTYHRFVFDLVFNPRNTYRYCIFHCNDKDITQEMPENFVIINDKKHDLQGTIDPRDNPELDMKTSGLEYLRKYIADSVHAY